MSTTIIQSVTFTIFIVPKKIAVSTYGQSAGWPDEPLVGRPPSVCGKHLNAAIFSDTINRINVKLRMMVVLIELYPFIPLSVTLVVFQGHSSVKQF